MRIEQQMTGSAEAVSGNPGSCSRKQNNVIGLPENPRASRHVVNSWGTGGCGVRKY